MVKELEKNRSEEIIGREVYECRQHYLRFEVSTTWRIQEKADHEGFRCGICLPFKPYDLLGN